MKIVYCLPQLYKPGGIERIVSIKANYFVERYGYEVYIITACQKGQVPFYHLSDKIKMIDLNIDYDSTLTLPIWKRICKKINYTHQHKKELSSLLKKIKPDITISTFTHEASFLPEIKDESKKVLEFHFCKGHKRKMAKAFHFSFMTKLAYYIRCWQEENIIIPKYDQFVVLTEEDKEQWITKNPNTICIPNILSFETVHQANLASKSAIAVGRLDAQKGFDTLIKMWANIVKQCRDWKLNIYGQGADESSLRNLINELNLNNSVFIHKPEQDIQKQYLESSIFLMTSNFEGWGLVLTEAMQCGLPAVAFACKCGPRDIITNGEDGFCIPYKDENTFIDCTIKLIQNKELRSIMGNQARKNIQRYSADNVMPQWQNLFNQIIK